MPLRVVLGGSKSISNRALIINALRGADPAECLEGLSAAADTQTLLRLLREWPTVCDAGDGGTTLRFLAAYAVVQRGCRIFTGSARMQERPIGPLVEALRQLGAQVQYLKREGYPPLQICGPARLTAPAHVEVAAHISSQFVSALLLVGPCLPGGLVLYLQGPPVSEPYLTMTLQVMRHFGAQTEMPAPGRIVVAPGGYSARPLRIEADWTAASYWYAMAALANEAHLILLGLNEESWQGDGVVAEWAASFGIRTTFGQEGGVPYAQLRKEHSAQPEGPLLFDFRGTPDLVQTFAVLCAALGVPAIFGGLETLPLKETDRCAALSAELHKVGASFRVFDLKQPHTYRLEGQAQWGAPPRLATYGDHRMAMAFAPLALLGPVDIENPDVVGKSYPHFWEHLQQAGFIFESLPA